MKIYTKTGDGGETGLFGGTRVPKDDVRVAAYGTVDELNAALGLARCDVPAELDPVLERLQSDLLVLGAELACAPGKTDRLKLDLLGERDVARLETQIDASESALSPLENFILPGGTATAARLHVARTVCRRAEREILTLTRTSEVRRELLVYLNRLSDLLFVLARRANAISGVPDVPWVTRP
jgi:cob(I)alamin adenosyltransferase